jgi:hypothetical protein
MIELSFVMHGRASRFRAATRTVHGMPNAHFTLCGRRPQRSVHLVTPITYQSAPAITCPKCLAVIKRNQPEEGDDHE